MLTLPYASPDAPFIVCGHSRLPFPTCRAFVMGPLSSTSIFPVADLPPFLHHHAAAGTDLLSGFGGGAQAAAASEGGNLSDMLTMSPGDIGGSGSTATPRKTSVAVTTASDDWLGLAGSSGNGQAASGGGGAAAPPTAAGEGGVGAVRAPASSGSLLDDWAGGGGVKSAAEGLTDRNQMLQQKVVMMKALVLFDRRVFWIWLTLLLSKAAAAACGDSMPCFVHRGRSLFQPGQRCLFGNVNCKRSSATCVEIHG